MKVVRSLLSIIFMVALLSSALELNASPIKQLSLSLWSEYKNVDFEGASQEEKTQKLQTLFEDKYQFVCTHGVRRVIVKILDPISYSFFNPENFDSSREDNFYYWALKLQSKCEVEALFDGAEFRLTPQSLSEKLYSYYEYYFKSEAPLGNFQDLADKLEWVSLANETFDHNNNKGPLIKGITLNPKGESERVCQNLVNSLDQYKHNGNELLSRNAHSSIRLAMIVNLDQKEFAFANLARFPLRTDLRGEKPQDIGVQVPENFPSEGPNYLPPEWRENNNGSLLDTVYVRMNDPRLVESIYQNTEVLPDPGKYNYNAIKTLSNYLGHNFRGTPFIKGPGYVSNARGTSDIEGLFTYFKTGGGPYQQGQFVNGSSIEIRPPYVSQTVRKIVSTDPFNNRQMKITSTFSTTQDIVKAEYYYTPIPMNWTYPKVSGKVHSAIYFVFSTDFEPKQGRFQGNWDLQNFVHFLYHSQKKTGFLFERFITGFNNTLSTPKNNLVLYDFTTIPNGHLYPECDWKLGNQTH